MGNDGGTNMRTCNGSAGSLAKPFKNAFVSSSEKIPWMRAHIIGFLFENMNLVERHLSSGYLDRSDIQWIVLFPFNVMRCDIHT